jgi:hypothetical protein
MLPEWKGPRAQRFLDFRTEFEEGVVASPKMFKLTEEERAIVLPVQLKAAVKSVESARVTTTKVTQLYTQRKLQGMASVEEQTEDAEKAKVKDAKVYLCELWKALGTAQNFGLNDTRREIRQRLAEMVIKKNELFPSISKLLTHYQGIEVDMVTYGVDIDPQELARHLMDVIPTQTRMVLEAMLAERADDPMAIVDRLTTMRQHSGDGCLGREAGRPSAVSPGDGGHGQAKLLGGGLPPRKDDTCGRCGRSPRHALDDCPAKGVKCKRCLKMDHFARHCRGKEATEAARDKEGRGDRSDRSRQGHSRRPTRDHRHDNGRKGGSDRRRDGTAKAANNRRPRSHSSSSESNSSSDSHSPEPPAGRRRGRGLVTRMARAREESLNSTSSLSETEPSLLGDTDSDRCSGPIDSSHSYGLASGHKPRSHSRCGDRRTLKSQHTGTGWRSPLIKRITANVTTVTGPRRGAASRSSPWVACADSGSTHNIESLDRVRAAGALLSHWEEPVCLRTVKKERKGVRGPPALCGAGAHPAADP